MRIAFLSVTPALVALLALSACDQPKFRDKPEGAAPAPATAATAAAPAAPIKAKPVPEPPAWAAAYIGKNLRTQFPKTGICKGNTDIINARYSGDPAGVEILGWGWDIPKKARVGRVVLVDRGMTIVGAGEGGAPRPDVPAATPEISDANSGWTAVTKLTAGPVDAYGVVGGGDEVCALGHLEF